MSRLEINFCPKIVGGIENLIVTFSKKMNILLCYSFHSGDEVWACPQCDVTSSYLPFWWWWWTQSCFSTLRLKNWSNGLLHFILQFAQHSQLNFFIDFEVPTNFLVLQNAPFYTLFEKSNLCPKIQFWQNPNIFMSFSTNFLSAINFVVALLHLCRNLLSLRHLFKIPP